MRSKLWIALGVAALLAAPHGVDAPSRTKSGGPLSAGKVMP
jgi:hypothetical protein